MQQPPWRQTPSSSRFQDEKRSRIPPKADVGRRLPAHAKLVAAVVSWTFLHAWACTGFNARSFGDLAKANCAPSPTVEAGRACDATGAPVACLEVAEWAYSEKCDDELTVAALELACAGTDGAYACAALSRMRREEQPFGGTGRSCARWSKENLEECSKRHF